MMKWTKHYTGLEYAEQNLGPLNLYLSRSSGKHMWRLSGAGSWPVPRWRWRAMFGGFVGWLNYGAEWGRGLELFTNKWHVGVIWSKPPGCRRASRVRWSGSMSAPYTTVTVRLGRLFIGRRTPGWLRRMKERRVLRQWENMNPHWDDAEYGFDPDEEYL